MRLQGDVVLRDIVDPGQEIRIREVVGIEDDTLSIPSFRYSKA